MKLSIDSTVCLENSTHIFHKCKKSYRDCMQIEVNQLSIKATTSEKMGFVGTEKGIAAHAVALLKME